MCNGELLEKHCDDECDCGSPMSMTRTRYAEYDYLQWICIDDACGTVEDGHQTHGGEKIV